MCYHYSLHKSKKEIEARFGAKFAEPDLFRPFFYVNGFEAPRVPVITNDKPYEIQMITWGLIPGWVKDEAKAKEIRFQTLNSRAESIFSKPSFRQAIKNQRCLILMDGFFDWRLVKNKKYPYYVYLKSREAFAVACIWESWKNPANQSAIKTFSIITAPANEFVAKIHNVKKRMPVILSKQEERQWLQELDDQEISALLNPYESDKMAGHPISKLITARGVERNVPEILEEFKYNEIGDINS